MKGREWRLPKLGWTLLLLQIAFAATQVHVLLGLSIEASSQFLDFTSHCILTAAPILPQFSINAKPELRAGGIHYLSLMGVELLKASMNQCMQMCHQDLPQSIGRGQIQRGREDEKGRA